MKALPILCLIGFTLTAQVTYERIVAAASMVSDEATSMFTMEPSLCLTTTNGPWKQSCDGEVGSVAMVQLAVTSSATAFAAWCHFEEGRFCVKRGHRPDRSLFNRRDRTDQAAPTRSTDPRR